MDDWAKKSIMMTTQKREGGLIDALFLHFEKYNPELLEQIFESGTLIRVDEDKNFESKMQEIENLKEQHCD